MCTCACTFRMPPKKGKVYRFHNCKLLRNNKLVTNDYLYVRDGKIINGEKLFYEERIPPDENIDCHNAIICPGFIDIQINGNDKLPKHKCFSLMAID